MAARLAVAVATVCLALVLTDAATADAAAASLGRAHLGVAVSAPTPPALGETATATYAWRRCGFYPTLVSFDGASDSWPLDDPSSSAAAADTVGSAPGRYVGSHTLAASGPLSGQGGRVRCSTARVPR